MNMTIDRKTLKSRAREQLRLSDPKSWKANCVYLLVSQLLPALIALLALAPMVNALLNFTERLVYNSDFMDDYLSGYYYGFYGGSYGYGLEREAAQLGMTLISALGIFSLIGIVLALFKTVMSYGHCSWSLKLWRGEHPGAGEMFSGFGHLGRVLGAGIMTAIFTFLWSMLFLLPGSLLTALALGSLEESAPALAQLLQQLVSVAMSVGVALVGCRYALTPYFIMSDPSMGVFDAIRASKNTMEGNIVQLFFLKLSFLGWLLLVWLIAFVVAMVAIFASTYASIFAAMAGNPELWSSYVSDETAFTVGMYILRGILTGGAVALVVGWLLSLPLFQWLIAYMGVTTAGFFDALTAAPAEDVRPDGETATDPSLPPVPPIPPAPPTDPFGQVDTPKVEDPFYQEVPQAPQLPAEPLGDTVGANVPIGPSASTPPEPPANEQV